MRYIKCSSLLLLVLFLIGQKPITPQMIEAQQDIKKLEGVYILVSRTKVIEDSEGRKSETKISAPEWKGIYIFKGGYYSQTLMKKDRSYHSKFPPYYGDLAYESFAGPYVVEGNNLKLENSMSLNQYSIGRSPEFEIKVEGDRLILSETLLPHIESRAKGKITTILQKIENSQH